MPRLRLATHRFTSRNLEAAYPWMADAGLGGDGVYIGRQLPGGAVCYDPWALYEQGAVTNPNMLVVGQVGRGKSSLVKTYLWRQRVFGRRAWIVDPKGEYTPLAAACGTTPIALGRSSPIRLNPLDVAGDDPALATRRRVELLGSLAAASLHRTLRPAERTGIEVGVRTATADNTRVLLGQVVDAMLWPDPDLAAEVNTTADRLADDCRDVALELRRLVKGDLAGLFDGPTTPGLDLAAPVVVLDLSQVYGSEALDLVMLCTLAWQQTRLSTDTAARSIQVTDEAWAVLRNVHVARYAQASFKLARQWGTANVFVVHRLSDLTATGAAGSEQAALAKGLLADTETRVVYAQPASEIPAATDLLGLSNLEGSLLPTLRRGVALWRVGARALLVEHRIGAAERALTDTDARMSA